MSHVVSIQTKVHDPIAVAAACRRLQLAAPVHGTAELFSGAATGMIIRLPGWQYPVVVDTLSGTMRYDNYEGRWGEQRELDKFLQIYAAEKTKLEANKRGCTLLARTPKYAREAYPLFGWTVTRGRQPTFRAPVTSLIGSRMNTARRDPQAIAPERGV
jgi:hypothetical protein